MKKVTDEQIVKLFERAKFLDKQLSGKLTKSNRQWLQNRYNGLCEAINLIGLGDEFDEYLFVNDEEYI